MYSADPDAAWYHRERDSRDGDAPSSGLKSQWGYELSIVVVGNDNPEKESALPSIVVGMAPLHRPGHDPGPNAIVALASVHARGHPAFFWRRTGPTRAPRRRISNSPPGAWVSNGLGLQGGSARCSGVVRRFLADRRGVVLPVHPRRLITATGDLRGGLIDEETYRLRLEERWRYRARPKASPDTEGHIRVSCPAAPYAVARCDLKPASLTLTGTQGRLRIPVRSAVRSDPPLSCTQASVTIPPDAGAKFHQDLLFGSPEWHSVYSTLRNSIEGFNGYVKDGAHEALDDSERRRLRGVAAAECPRGVSPPRRQLAQDQCIPERSQSHRGWHGEASASTSADQGAGHLASHCCHCRRRAT